jgi:hypothetical protein
MQHKIIYIYDALCGWCYGFSPVMQQLQEKYAGKLEFEVLSGGMIMGLRAGPIGEVAAYIEKAYPDVESETCVYRCRSNGSQRRVPFRPDVREREVSCEWKQLWGLGPQPKDCPQEF